MVKVGSWSWHCLHPPPRGSGHCSRHSFPNASTASARRVLQRASSRDGPRPAAFLYRELTKQREGLPPASSTSCIPGGQRRRHVEAAKKDVVISPAATAA